ncbi:MAG: relaxase/mobilization nuclease domain-containing protein [Clostridiaceae bacterium]|nr:relaxase/mobilization nuclease domain-containing protein [Clostridiaceae bacterium]
MAILKFISRTYPVSGNCFGSVKRTINYITNPVKTEQGRYVSSLNCPFHPSQAFQKMKHTTIHYGKASDNPNNRLGYHWTISWSPEEKVTEEQAFEVAEKFCAAVLPEQEVIFSVHNDKGHMHAHIYFNSVNLYSGKKFHYSSGDWKTVFQPALDQINQECGLQTLEESTGIPLESYSKKRKKPSRYGSLIKRKESNNPITGSLAITNIIKSHLRKQKYGWI